MGKLVVAVGGGLFNCLKRVLYLPLNLLFDLPGCRHSGIVLFLKKS